MPAATGPRTIRAVDERRWRAMGSDFHLVVVGGRAELAIAALARVEELEARWSRFRPGSELNRLHATAGRPALVSSDLLLAVSTALEGRRATNGRFDPTVLPALLALGYDRDFDELPRERWDVTGEPEPAAGADAIVIDPVVRAITLPAGTAIDLGGIGKGLAADLVVASLLDAGAAGACVNAGGDLRVAGEAPTGAGWIVAVEHRPDLRIALADGAVATSSPGKRRWTRAGIEHHHLLDPRSGRPAATGLAAVTVIAGSAATAEVLTKAAFVAGPDEGAAIITAAGATGLLVTDAGTDIALAGLDELLR